MSHATLKARHGTNWRYYPTCPVCGSAAAQPCLNLTALQSHAKRQEPVEHPHIGRERMATDQTPLPPPPPECRSVDPFYGLQCGMGLHDGQMHGQYDRELGPVFWREPHEPEEISQ